MAKYLNNNKNNNLILNNDLSLTSQLIEQIENLNLGGEDKKLFDFIWTCTKRTPGSRFGRVILCVQGEGSESRTNPDK